MAVALGEGEVKTLEDFAGLVGDDIRGWFEAKNGERVRKPGLLESYQLTQEQVDVLILNARVAAGWIEAPEPEPEAQSDAEAGDENAQADSAFNSES
jgi:N utilization substance protein A